MQEHHLLELLCGIIPWLDPPDAVSKAIECGKSERLYPWKLLFPPAKLLCFFAITISHLHFGFLQRDAWRLSCFVVHCNCYNSLCVWPTVKINKVSGLVSDYEFSSFIIRYFFYAVTCYLVWIGSTFCFGTQALWHSYLLVRTDVWSR